MLYRQSLIRYAKEHGVTKAAIRYKTNRQYINATMEPYNHWLTDLTARTVIQISIRRMK